MLDRELGFELKILENHVKVEMLSHHIVTYLILAYQIILYRIVSWNALWKFLDNAGVWISYRPSELISTRFADVYEDVTCRVIKWVWVVTPIFDIGGIIGSYDVLTLLLGPRLWAAWTLFTLMIEWQKIFLATFQTLSSVKTILDLWVVTFKRKFSSHFIRKSCFKSRPRFQCN